MDWIQEVLTSQFVWGIAIGILLSTFSAWLSMELQQRKNKRLVVGFCQDLASNVTELADQIEENRAKNNFIDRRLLDLIDIEIGIYGRNRETLAALKDQRMRREVREFFTRTAISTNAIQVSLNQFDANYDPNPTALDPKYAAPRAERADSALQRANTQCDHLRNFMTSHGAKFLSDLSTRA